MPLLPKMSDLTKLWRMQSSLLVILYISFLSARSLVYVIEWDNCVVIMQDFPTIPVPKKLSRREIFMLWHCYTEGKSPFKQLLATIKHYWTGILLFQCWLHNIDVLFNNVSLRKTFDTAGAGTLTMETPYGRGYTQRCSRFWTDRTTEMKRFWKHSNFHCKITFGNYSAHPLTEMRSVSQLNPSLLINQDATCQLIQNSANTVYHC